jgi:rhamnose transport system permease protein
MARYRSELVVTVALAAVGAVLAFGAPTFFVPGNLLEVLLATLPVLIAAVGATVVILAGDIDISAGAVFAVCSVAAGALAVAGVPIVALLVLVPVIGALAGAVNGVLVAYAGLPAIVVTLAAMVAWRDALRWVTQGAWVQGLPQEFQWLGLSQDVYPIAAIAVAGIVTIGTAWALSALAGGRAVYATGSNAAAAHRVGLDTRRVRFWSLVFAGACTGLAALLNAVRFSQVPANAGLGLELQVIAAVVVGGTAIAGGRGTIGGTVLGVLLFGTMRPALTFLGASAFWEGALQGAIILTAVAIDAVQSRRRSGPGVRARAASAVRG